MLATHTLIGWLSLRTPVIEHLGSRLGEARQVPLFVPLLDEESETLTAQTWGGALCAPQAPPCPLLSYVPHTEGRCPRHVCILLQN